MKKFLMFFLVVVGILFISACVTKPAPEYELVTNVGNGGVLPPKAMIQVSLKDVKTGKEVASTLKVTKDGKEILNTSGVKHNFAAEDEGTYVVTVVPKDGSSGSKTLTFKVTALEKEVYLDGGTILYDYIPSNILAKKENILLRFYKYEDVTIPGTTETYSERKRLNLVDTNEDGLYDAWETLPATDSGNHKWYEFPYSVSYGDTILTIYFFEYAEDHIIPWYLGTSGTYKGYLFTMDFAEVGFDLNKSYARYVQPKTSGSPYSLNQFTLHERYNSDTKPVFYLTASTDTINAGDKVTVYVQAENVADFAKLYDVRYMQLSVKHSKELELSSVKFNNFMQGLKDIGTYKKNDESIVLYKAFLTGSDETQPATTTFATLEFTVKEATPTSVQLVYEGWWNTYGDYPDKPNPVFKDTSNSNVDGFIIDHQPIEFVTPGLLSEGGADK
ncbi:MAG TPA: cohesin domain-containing protein [Fervidobacterium sp.]|nr:cohesin domain-containing protein [Fervidobacterium sp.]HQE49952.1 cohesin domain-containing protein [Fervidobacterium sp.]HUM44173.1 cohesin domain-containing protein [Fervidobacterium sp.]